MKKREKRCPTSLPGGDLVDGLPPAASTDSSCLTEWRSDRHFRENAKFFKN